MTIGRVGGPQLNAARLAALACLISFPIVIAVNFGIMARLVVSSDPAATARNIVAHETLFRVGAMGDLLYCVSVVLVSAGLYVVLRPISQTLALIAALFRLIHGFTWLLATLHLFTALRLVTDARYSSELGASALGALLRLHLSGFDAYYVGLPFWSIAATIGSYLWLKSNYIPRALATIGLISSAWCVFCAVVFLVFPGFSNVVNLWLFDSPMTLFELALSVWLLAKGLRQPVVQ
jgi:hypothetical protein